MSVKVLPASWSIGPPAPLAVAWVTRGLYVSIITLMSTWVFGYLGGVSFSPTYVIEGVNDTGEGPDLPCNTPCGHVLAQHCQVLFVDRPMPGAFCPVPFSLPFDVFSPSGKLFLFVGMVKISTDTRGAPPSQVSHHVHIGKHKLAHSLAVVRPASSANSCRSSLLFLQTIWCTIPVCWN